MVGLSRYCLILPIFIALCAALQMLLMWPDIRSPESKTTSRLHTLSFGVRDISLTNSHMKSRRQVDDLHFAIIKGKFVFDCP